MIKMHSLCSLITFAFLVQATIALNNDIVASFHCKLLCKEGGGFVQELTAENVCKCKVDQTITGAKLAKLEELSSYYKLPLILIHRHLKQHVKRQLNSNLLDDLRDQFEQNPPLWINLDDSSNEHAIDWGKYRKQLEDNLKSWQRDAVGNVFDYVAPKFEEYKNGIDKRVQSWGEQQPSWLDVIPKFEEHTQDWKDTLRAWQENEAPALLGQIAPTWEEQQKQLQEQHEELEDKLREHIDNFKSNLPSDLFTPIAVPSWEEQQPQLHELQQDLESKLREHAENLKAYFPPESFKAIVVPNWEEQQQQFEEYQQSLDDKLREHWENLHSYYPTDPVNTVVGQMPPTFTKYDPLSGVNVNNVFSRKPSVFAPLAVPIPQIYQQPAPLGSISPIIPQLAAPMPLLFQQRMANDDEQNGNDGEKMSPITLNPLLENLKKPIDDMRNNMRIDSAHTARNWLKAFLPSDTPSRAAAISDENGHQTESSTTEDSDKLLTEQDADESHNNREMRMQAQLKDATQTMFEQHIVDSVKKNLRDDKKSSMTDVKGNQMVTPKMNNRSVIVQPEQYMNDTEEDLETLA